MTALRMSANSDPTSAAGAIAQGIRDHGETEIVVIGPRAVNQTVKAIAVARSYVAASGVDVYFVPSFCSIRVAETDEERTAISFSVRPRHVCASTPVVSAAAHGAAAGD